MVRGSSAVFLLSLSVAGSALVTVEVLQPTALRTQLPTRIAAQVLNTGEEFSGDSVVGQLWPVKDCGETLGQKPDIWIVGGTECDVGEVYLRAVQARAIGLVVVQAGLDLKLIEGVSMKMVPIVGISGNEGEVMLSEGEGAVVNITYSGDRDCTVAVVLSLDRETDSVFEEVLGVLEQYSQKCTVEVVYDFLPNTAVLNERENAPEGKSLLSERETKRNRELIRQQCVRQLTGTNALLTYIRLWLSEDSSDSPHLPFTAVGISETEINNCTDSYQSPLYPDTLPSVPFPAPAISLSGHLYSPPFDKSTLESALCELSPGSLPTCPPTVQTEELRTIPRLLQDDTNSCSPGCYSLYLVDGKCHAECDNPDCEYGKWTCRCAKDCPPILLKNDVCDLGCNSTACNYDNKQCLSPDLSRPARFVDNSSHGWQIGLGLGLFSLCLLTTIITVTCIAVWKVRKHRAQHMTDNPPQSRTAKESIDLVLMIQRLNFNPSLVDFSSPTCAICLADFVLAEGVVKTSCRHLFHFDCMKHWLEQHSHCPICMRHPFDVPAEEPSPSTETPIVQQSHKGDSYGE